MCFPRIFKIYFEAIAKIAATIRKKKSVTPLAGVIIKAKIRAVIKFDSILVCTLNNFSKILFVTYETATKTREEATKEKGVKGRIPNILYINATAKRRIK